jgi:hypothetical protein
MLPAVLGWMLWVRMYRQPGVDLVNAYYTDYTKDLLYNATFSNYWLFVWKNSYEWMTGVGSLLMPVSDPDPMTRFVLYALALGAVVGAVRLCLRVPAARPFGVYAALLSVLLIIWCYPPNSRLVLPLFPLVAAGFFGEVRRMLEMLGSSWKSGQRGAAVVVGGLLVAGAMFGVRKHIAFWSQDLPATYQQQERLYAESLACFAFVRAHTEPGARFVAWNDPVLYLYTDRHGNKALAPVAYWYEDRSPERVAYVAQTAATRADYVYWSFDYSLDLSPEQSADLRQRMEKDPRLEEVFRSGGSVIWRVKRPGRT